MSKITINKICKRNYEFKGIDTLASRQAMKFNIFLNSITNISIERNDDCITIEMKTDEYHLEINILESIVKHLEKQNCELIIDKDILSMVKDLLRHQDEVRTTIEMLKLIQDDSDEVEIQFKEFCSFCNSTLKIELRSYQYKSAFLLSMGKGGFDFSVPGSGKTIITYAAYAYLKFMGIVNHVFIIGPGSSYNAWFDEYATCFGRTPNFENLSEGTTKECKIYLNASAKNHKEIDFINMEKVRLISDEIIQCISNSNTFLIIDEAHKIKNPDAAVTQAVLKIAKHACSRVILTGTPMPNGYEDLYSLTKTFSPINNILPYNYMQLKNMSKNETSQKQIENIRKSIEPYYSRISKKYLLETKELLPPKFHMVLCEMDETQSRLYSQLNEFCGKINDDLDGDILSNLKKAVLIRKMQISANPALLESSLVSSMDELQEEYNNAYDKNVIDIELLVKADRQLMNEFSNSTIFKTVNQYSNGTLITDKNNKAVELTKILVTKNQKVLIWDIFVKNMNILRQLIESTLKIKVELVNGSVVGIDRQMAIKRFREGESMVLLANPATLAESISLHKICQNAIYVNKNFNAAQYIQSKDRIHRINMPLGTTANYYFLINDNTIDYSIDERLKFKERRMLVILDADDIEVGGSEMEDSNIMSIQDIDDAYWR